MSDFLSIYLWISNGLYLFVLLAIVTVGQILLRHRDKKRTYPESWPTVSVLISAKNEEKAIEECINSLLNLEYPIDKLDIWLVDDQSSDATGQLIQSFADEHAHLHVLSTEGYRTHLKAKARGISLAAKHAQGEWFFITDADSVVHPLWIKEMLRGSTDKTGTIAGMMTVDEKDLVSSVEKIIWSYTLPFAFGAAGYGAEFISVGPNTAMRSSIYRDAGGLEKANFQVAEDLALFNMVVESGYKALAHNNKETMVRMKSVANFKQLLSQQRRWIKGPFEQAWYYPVGIAIVFGFSFLYHIAITVAFFVVPKAALMALLSRFVAEFCSIATEKILLKQPKVLRYLPMLFIYLYFVFIFLPISFMISRKVSWQGEGYKIDYNQSMSIEIKQVETKKDFRKFIQLPYKLYKGNSNWVPPMRMDEADTHDRKKNPAFEKADAVYWLAYKNSQLVGRVVGIKVLAEVEEQKMARFGWIDFIDDKEVSQALVNTVENWAKEAGLKALHGPMGFCDMDPNGMQVDGFDEYATMATIYHPEYAHKHLLNLGYNTDAEWLEYEANLDFEFSEKDYTRTEFIKERFGLEVAPVNKQKDIVPYSKAIFHLINKTYVNLYGFYPLSEKQIEHYIEKYLKFVRTDYISLILKEKKLVGFGIGMPSFSEALQKNDGKLFPVGWVEMLKAFRSDDVIDFYLVSADPEYANLGITRLVFFEIFKNLKKNGTKKVYMNPILKDNMGSKGMWSSNLATEKDVWVRKKRHVFIKHFNNE